MPKYKWTKEQKERRNELERQKRLEAKKRKSDTLVQPTEIEKKDLEVNCSKECFLDSEDPKFFFKTLAIRFLLAGFSFSEFKKIYNFYEEQQISKKDWQDLELVVYKEVDILADNILKDERKKYEKEDLTIIMDCRWGTTGFDAYEATVSAFHGESNTLLGIYNIYRRDPLKNFSGSAKGMEGFGVKQLCLLFKQEGLNISTILHDGDSSAINNARSVFPTVTEWRCVNHVAKNFR